MNTEDNELDAQHSKGRIGLATVDVSSCMFALEEARKV